MRRIHSLSICTILTIVNIAGAQQSIADSNALVLNNCFEGEVMLETSDVPPNDLQCRISVVDKLMVDRIHSMLREKSPHLLEYQLKFKNYSNGDDPLTVNVKRHYRANIWMNVLSHHGQTLMSLAFNYAVISLSTLDFKIERRVVELADDPVGCFGLLREHRKVDLVQRLLLTDFKLVDGSNASMDLVGEDEQKLCHKVVHNESGYALFADCCCATRGERCETRASNKWLTLLNIALHVIRLAVILFGPLIFLPSADKLDDRQVSYKVCLKEPLSKKIALVCLGPDESLPENISSKRRINFSKKELTDLPNLRKSLEVLKKKGIQSLTQQCFEAKIHDYHITVDYDRLFGENEVPVSFRKSFFNNLFMCELGEAEAFAGCCTSRLCPIVCKMKWINFWRIVGLGLLAIVIPTPYYIRIVIFYFYEYDEIMRQQAAAENLSLKSKFEGSLLQYLTPHHPTFLLVYALYLALFISWVYGRMSRKTKKTTVVYEMAVNLISDLRGICLTDVLTMVISNVIWPFEKFGVLGVFVALVYWPIVLPVTLLVAAIYFLPTAYLTFRLCLYPIDTFLHRVFAQISEKSEQLFQTRHIWKHFFEKDSNESSVETGNKESQIARRGHRATVQSGFIFGYDKSMDKIASTDMYRDKASSSDGGGGGGDGQVNDNNTSESEEFKCTQVIKRLLASTFGIACLFSVFLIVYEVITCLTEVAVYTMMGVIVNSDSVLKYVALIALVVIYIYDSFNNVGQQYFKLSRALFTIAKDRVKVEQLERVTSQTSEMQKNVGFKTQEMNEQGYHEDADDVDSKVSRNWFINDLVLFVDRDDVPRIPKKLFNEMCTIQVKGVPGPVYVGFCSAVKQFVKIIVLVIVIFLAILAFGEVSGLSATNQTMAAVVGGMFPLLMKTVLKAPDSDVHMETVSYTNKLNEIINNFNQRWPMFDFSFTLNDGTAAAAASTDKGEASPATERLTIDLPSEPTSAKNIPRRTTMPRRKSTRRTAAGRMRSITNLMRKTYAQKMTVDILILLPEGYEDHLGRPEQTEAPAPAEEKLHNGNDRFRSISKDQVESTPTRPRSSSQ